MEARGADSPGAGPGGRAEGARQPADPPDDRGPEAADRSRRGGVEGLFDVVMANAPVAAVIVDLSLTVLITNPAFDRVWEGAKGSALLATLPELGEGLRPLLEAARHEGTAADRVELRSAVVQDGRRPYWQASVFPLDGPDGTRVGVGLFLNDVTEERRVARRLADSVARLDVILAAGGLATWDWDLLRNEARWGPSSLQALGVAADQFDSNPESFLAAVHPDDRDAAGAKILAAVESGGEFREEVRVARTDDRTQWMEVRGKVVRAANGTPRRMVGVVADVTQRRLADEIRSSLLDREHEARLASEAARERLALVAEVGATLMGKLDTRSVLAAVPPLLVPRLGDWCIADLIGPAGETVEVAIVHADPDRVEDVRQLRTQRLRAGGYGLWSIRRAMRTGMSELVHDIGDDDLVDVSSTQEHLDLLRALAPRAAITVPLISQGEVLGGLTLVACGDRLLEPDDLTLIETVAGRVATAMDNARLFESRSQVARALQQTLLPPTLPNIPGAEMAVRYRVAADGIDIGGDFYDAFPLADGAWAVSIGDVCGKGAGAAAVTGLFRHTLRAVATAESSPAKILRATNDVILGQIEDTRFCTAVLMTVRPHDDGLTVTVCCAGHPRPIVVRANGEVARVDVAGTLLGVLPEPVLMEVDLRLEVGDAVVLFTDGVTEARSGPEQFGDERLAVTLEEAARVGVADADQLAGHLEQAVDDFRDARVGDDLAIVVLRAATSPRV